jgi:S1-C subfamily serine protease
MDNLLSALSNQIASAVAKAAANVVTVHGRPRVTSSGIVWAKGLVATADHTLTRTEGIHLTLADGRRVEAKLHGRDSATGIALLIADEVEAPALEASAVDLRPGAMLVAVGRNADTGPTASLGILSAAGGPWRTWRGGTLDRFLRLDMSLHPGSAGGIVVDGDGRFFGMAHDGLSRLSPLALPVSTLERVIAELRERGRVARAYLGVGLQGVETKSGAGAIVLSVEADSAADSAGLLVGDVLTALNGFDLAGPDDVQEFLAAHPPGAKVAARIVRGGQNIELSIELGERLR